MGLINRLRALIGYDEEERDVGSSPLSLDQWLSYFSFGGMQYPFIVGGTAMMPQEIPSGTFESYVQALYKRNGVVFACMAARHLLFSEARFQFRQLRGGRPGDLFGTPALQLLEQPWPGGTTGDLLGRAIQDVDLAGNFYATIRRGRIVRLRPDWVTIITGVPGDPESTGWELDAELIGYMYQPGGPQSGEQPVMLGREEVAHFAPLPDPEFRYRGMSWLTPVLKEILADGAASDHKLKFFEQGATPAMVIKWGEIPEAKFNAFVQKIRKQNEGGWNAYKTLFLAGGADVTPIGQNLQQLDFKNVQGAGETRIAAAAGIPPVIVGLSEGLQAATYSNYAQARRRFADGTMRPLWRNMAGSLAMLVPPPAGAELWYDDRDIPFLREDKKDAAEIQQIRATTVKSLIDAGFEPATVVDAVDAEDMSRLTHTGLYSVQLQPPGTILGPNGTTPPALPAANGKTPATGS